MNPDEGHECLVGNDLAEAADVLVEAFWTYPETVHLLPSLRTRRFGLRRFVTQTCRDALPGGEVLVARRGGAIVAVAAWKPPIAARQSWLSLGREGLELMPVGVIAPNAAVEGVRSSMVMRRRHPTQPHHYLAILGVSPAWQGHGIGRQLVAAVTARADQESTGCYLSTATKDNVSWYQGAGFTVSEEFHPTPRWPTVWRMWRDPTTAAT